MVSPFSYLPPQYVGFPEPWLPYNPYGLFMDGQGAFFEPFYSFEYGAQNELWTQDESMYGEYDDDGLQQPGYPRPEQYSALRGQDLFLQAGAQTGTGEPHGYDEEDEPRPLMNSEGSGDVQVDPEAYERNMWDNLQDSYYGPVVTHYGTVSVMLRNNMCVDITPERAVRLVNFDKHCTAAISCWGDRSCICHPCGRAIQDGVNVDMATGTRVAKISSRGITFTTLNHGLVYLVDASGTKSTTERFQNLSYDLPMSVFYPHSERDRDAIEDCVDLISQARHHTSRNGDEIWVVGGVRIKQTPWGDVQVSRDSGRRVIWSSPTAGSVSVTTPFIKMAATCDPSKYFFVRAGQKTISGTADGFVVRNGSQRAGFDSRGRLTLP